jgi:hypothetical protein
MEKMLQQMDKAFCSTHPHFAFVTTTSEDDDKDEDKAIPREDNGVSSRKLLGRFGKTMQYTESEYYNHEG